MVNTVHFCKRFFYDLGLLSILGLAGFTSHMLAMDAPLAQKPANERLLAAAASGTKNDIEKALLDGARLTAIDSEGRSALYLALFFNPQGAVIAQHLIKRGASIDARLVIKNINFESFKKASVTLLHCAAYMGRHDIVTFLLENDASINATTYRRENALYFATAAGQREIMKLLIERGLSPKGMLRVAVECCQMQAVRLLIEEYQCQISVDDEPILRADTLEQRQMVAFLQRKGIVFALRPQDVYVLGQASPLISEQEISRSWCSLI